MNKDITGIGKKEIESSVRVFLPFQEEITEEDNLLEMGLNSLQIMRLANKWRKNGLDITFAKLISKPFIKAWYEMMQISRFGGKEGKGNEFIEKRDKTEPFSLTDVQYAYWMGRRKNQILGNIGCHAYIEIEAHHIQVDKMRDSWKTVVLHHPMLRTQFTADGEQLVMDRPYSTEAIVHDLRGVENEALEEKLTLIRNRLSHRLMRIDLGQVVGLEISLLPDEGAKLHFDIDLLVADVQSFHIILRDLALVYTGEALPRSSSDWDFGQYLAKEALRRRQEKEQAELYWKNRIPNLPEAPGLPLIKKQEEIERPLFKRRSFFLEQEVWEKLKANASFNKTTPAMMLLAGYAMTLGKWSEVPRFLLNLPLFDRQTGEYDVEDVVADFTNLLLLEVNINENKTYLEKLHTLQEQFYKDMEHTAYSGVEVQREMIKQRGGGRLFAPVVFACNLGTELITERFRKNIGRLTYMISQTPQIWLDMQTYEMEGGLLIAWDAVEELFSAHMLGQMFEAYEMLLRRLSRSAEWDINIDLLPEVTKTRCRSDIDRVVSQTEGDYALHRGFCQMADMYPEHIALIDSDTDKKWSYREIKLRIRKAAALLKKSGVKPGERIAVTLPRGVDQIVAVIGILSVGAVYVPVGVLQPDSRRKAIHKKIGITTVITDTHGRTGISWPSGTCIISIEDAEHELPAKEIIFAGGEETAYIILTSGSTGEPKGVEISHNSACNTLLDVNQKNGIGMEDSVLAVSAIDFDLSVYDIFGILGKGGSVILLSDDRRRDAEFWMHCIEKYKITLWNSVPILLDMLLVAACSMDRTLLTMKHVFLSGDWIGLNLPERLKQAAPDSRLVSMGGATEASVWSNYFDVTLPLPETWKSIPYGRPLKNQVYRVVNESGRDCPDLVPGELWIGGAGVAKGYTGDIQLTEKKFVKQGGLRWYKTGDMGCFWEDGTIEFLGRKDFQVKIRGHRIELGEIESALEKDSNIADAIVTSYVDDSRVKHLAAYIVPVEKEKWDREKAMELLKTRVPDYMVPAIYVLLDRLPLSANGKIDRNALPKPDLKESRGNAGKKDWLKTPAEQILFEIWTEVLGVDSIDPESSYFELGGDSLMATKLRAKLKERSKAAVTLEDLFGNPVFKDQAGRLEELMSTVEPEGASTNWIEKIRPCKEQVNDPFPLTDIQQAYWIGRKQIYALGGITTHYYFELETDALNLERLEQAWNALIKRHGMMRAIILEDGENQVIRPDMPVYCIPCYDLRNNLEAEDILKNVRNEMGHKKFSINTWPLFDVRISKLSSGDDRIHICFDNIIFDGWSIALVLNEWAKLYIDQETKLPELELSFRDYVLKMHELKKTDAYLRDQEYWLNRVKTLPMAPDLPLKVNPDSIDNPKFVHMEKVMDKGEWEAFKEKAAKINVTPTAVFLAAYSEVLCMWSRRPKFTINLTRFNRLPLHGQVEKIVGDFTQLTLLEVDCKSEETFLKRCLNIQRQLAADLEHSLVCGVEVQRMLSKERKNQQDIKMPVVFTSAIGLKNSSEETGKDWLGHRIYTMSETPQVWLDHQISEQDGNLLLVWDVLEEVFPEKMAEDMFKAYGRLINQLLSDPLSWVKKETNITELPVFEERDKANCTDYPKSEDNLVSAFKQALAGNSGRTAIIAKDKTITYEELDRISDEIAERLVLTGVMKNQLTAVLMEKGWEQVAGVVGILKAGGAYLPLDPSNPRERNHKILKESEAIAILTQSWIKEAKYFEEKCSVIQVDKITAESKKRDLPQINASDLAYVIYTSGTSGMPKGVVITHHNAVNTIEDINRRFHICNTDKCLALSNLNFDLSVYDIFGMLSAGGTVVIPDRGRQKDPAHWYELINRHGVTVWNTVPAFMQILVDSLSYTGSGPQKSLKLVLMSGDWIPVELPDKIKQLFIDSKVVSLGGATEAAIWSNYYVIENTAPKWKSIPYGKPLSNQKFYIFNSLMKDCPMWVPGELYIAGDGVAQGYWKDQKRTSDKFLAHPVTGERIYKTGDIGRYLSDGNMEFMGREDFQVKINGFRIELGEIEAAIKDVMGIKEAAVSVVQKPGGSHTIAAHLVLEEGGEGEIFETVNTDQEKDALVFHDLVNFINSENISENLLEYEKTGAAFQEVVELCALKTMVDTLEYILSGQETFTVSQLISRGMVLSKYETVINRWIELLVKRDVLIMENSGFCIDKMAFSCLKEELRKKQESEHNKDLIQLEYSLKTLLEKNIVAFTKILCGETNPLQLFMEENNQLTPQEISKYNIQNKPVTNAMAEITGQLSALMTDENQEVRILEIGTRAGSFTREIPKIFENKRIQYTYADESTYFLEKKKEELKDLKVPVNYCLMDMNTQMSLQDQLQESYHIIIADNTLHRFKNVDRTIKNLQNLLIPGGFLLFTEAVNNNGLMALTVSFFEDGYSHLEDMRRNSHLPLLGAGEWKRLLVNHSFSQMYLLPEISLTQIIGIVQNLSVKCKFNPERLKGILAGKLPSYMLPHDYCVLEQLPLSANGKVDRNALKEMASELKKNKKNVLILPITEIQKAVAKVFCEIFHKEEIGITDSFFELGGDSLRAIQCTNLLKNKYDIPVTLAELFQCQTIEKIEELVNHNNAVKLEDCMVEGEI